MECPSFFDKYLLEVLTFIFAVFIIWLILYSNYFSTTINVILILVVLIIAGYIMWELFEDLYERTNSNRRYLDKLYGCKMNYPREIKKIIGEYNGISNLPHEFNLALQMATNFPTITKMTKPYLSDDPYEIYQVIKSRSK